MSKLSELLDDSETIQHTMKRIEKISASKIKSNPDDINIIRKALKEKQSDANNYLKFISKGNFSNLVTESLAIAEKNIETLKAELHALEQAGKQVFKSPPLEWIKHCITNIKETLEKQPEQSALLLRKLLGEIRLVPTYPDIGKPYYTAHSKLQPLVLLEEKRPHKGPLSSEPDEGSNALHWWTGHLISVAVFDVCHTGSLPHAQGRLGAPAVQVESPDPADYDHPRLAHRVYSRLPRFVSGSQRSCPDSVARGMGRLATGHADNY